ncbi:unknown [Mycoplasma sp. CAG:877]|nr:unknown [Mycoplasma sp. CAG:877]
MKVYFIFDVKEQFISLYQNNYRVLYNILRQIYYLDREEVNYAYTLFRQLVNTIDKNTIDRDIFLKLHRDIPYSKRGNVHYINNLYKDEVSRLTIKKSYIRLETEQLNSSFFEVLKKYSSNYFVCDFKNYNYFFLSSSKLGVGVG